MTQIKSVFLSLSFFSLGLIAAYPQHEPKLGPSPDEPAIMDNGSHFGLGAFVNSGYGTNEFTAVSGINVLLGRFPVSVSFSKYEEETSISMSLDWLVAEAPILGTRLRWYAGPGAYGGWARAYGNNGYAGGARLLLGSRFPLFGSFEFFTSFVPSFGFAAMDGQRYRMWNVDAEIGLRYLFSRRRGRIMKDASIPTESLTPSTPVALRIAHQDVFLRAVGAFSPIGKPAILEFSTEPAFIDDLASWRLDLIGSNGAVARILSGSGDMPRSLIWDGRNSAGAIIDGSYIGMLSLLYLDGTTAQSSSAPVLLDSTPPRIELALPKDFCLTPDHDGVDDTAVFGIAVADASPIASWSIEITDPAGQAFYHREGEGPVPSSLSWDGLGTDGELVQSEQDYGYCLRVTDSLAKSAEAGGRIRTGFLFVKKGSGYKLDLPGLVFRPNEADLVNDQSEVGERNSEILAQLAQLLKQRSGTRITIVGHAVNVSGTRREEAELGVLSLARAQMIKFSLVRLGLDPGRIATAGKGGTQPVVPHNDTVNNWKNRRVEFILSKE